MDEILKLMYKNMRKNKGKPIVAVVFDDDYNVLSVESNFPRKVITTLENSWFLNSIDFLGHAEWNAIEAAKKSCIYNQAQKYNIIITTSPCDSCFGKIEYLNSFNKVFFLFNKNNNYNNKYKTNNKYIHFKRTKLLEEEKEKEMREIFDEMYKQWIYSDNLSKKKRKIQNWKRSNKKTA